MSSSSSSGLLLLIVIYVFVESRLDWPNSGTQFQNVIQSVFVSNASANCSDALFLSAVCKCVCVVPLQFSKRSCCCCWSKSSACYCVILVAILVVCCCSGHEYELPMTRLEGFSFHWCRKLVIGASKWRSCRRIWDLCQEFRDAASLTLIMEFVFASDQTMESVKSTLVTVICILQTSPSLTITTSTNIITVIIFTRKRNPSCVFATLKEERERVSCVCAFCWLQFSYFDWCFSIYWKGR